MGKLGICLAGGGAKGAYQIGAWKALRELGIDSNIEVFSGCSIGSINVALMATGDYDFAYDIWSSMNKGSVISFDKSIIKRLTEHKNHIFSQGLFDTNRIKDLLNENLDYKAVAKKDVFATLSDSGKYKNPIAGCLNMYYNHIIKGKDQAIYINMRDKSKEEIIEIIMGSCALPFVFKNITINGRNYYDGGLIDNLPIKPLIESGCTTIIAIDLLKSSIRPHISIPKDVKFYMVKPTVSLGNVLDFSSTKISSRINQGYKDTLDMFKDIDLLNL